MSARKIDRILYSITLRYFRSNSRSLSLTPSFFRRAISQRAVSLSIRARTSPTTKKVVNIETARGHARWSSPSDLPDARAHSFATHSRHTRTLSLAHALTMSLSPKMTRNADLAIGIKNQSSEKGIDPSRSTMEHHRTPWDTMVHGTPCQ